MERPLYFNPRSRTGSDAGHPAERRNKSISTHAPARGATRPPDDGALVTRHFNPRSPHGERRWPAAWARKHFDFNPRSPHGERQRSWTLPSVRQTFQPTLPARGATRLFPPIYHAAGISTHAPRTGSDGERFVALILADDFNPRSPHGERPGESSISSQLSQFQPTLPARGATVLGGKVPLHFQQFQPTLPARGATINGSRLAQPAPISTHAPRTGSDFFHRFTPFCLIYFNPRSPHGERRHSATKRLGG